MTTYERLTKELERREQERRRIIQHINFPDRRRGEDRRKSK